MAAYKFTTERKRERENTARNVALAIRRGLWQKTRGYTRGEACKRYRRLNIREETVNRGKLRVARLLSLAQENQGFHGRELEMRSGRKNLSYVLAFADKGHI